MSSCVRETISGGTVTVGTEQSGVEGGRVFRSNVACDSGNLVLRGDKPGQFAGRNLRGAAASMACADSNLVQYMLFRQ
jgi:hypothetical protein